MTKIKINRNILLTGSFVNELSALGVKYVSLSPGSRNTSLTLAFANNKKIKSLFILMKEAADFLPLDLLKHQILRCCSLYFRYSHSGIIPAIVEAYQQRVP